LGGGGQSFFEPFFGQPLPGLNIGRIARLDRPFAVQAEEGLDLAHHLAAGGPGLEHLPEEAFEGQAQTEDPLPAVGALVLGGQQPGGQEVAQVLLELGQGGLAERLGGAAAQGGQPGAEGGKKGCS
jgi:hypothetical protein